MIAFQLSEAAGLLHGQLHGRDARFSSVSADTRTLQTGDLFIALSGPNFDGHDYVSVAQQQGAMGALVEREVAVAMPTVEVSDTRLAMGRLAHAWRGKADAQVIGITGSNGKTTLKEMLASILGQRHPVLATRGNLNNDIGMPLTLMRLQDERYAVIEMGANHAGEIAYLSHIARPDIAILNNAGRAHLEGFGSVEGVARAKAEILEGLTDGGVFVFNADDPHAGLWQALAAEHRRIGFGLGETADVRSPCASYRLDWVDSGFRAVFEVVSAQARFEVTLRLAGEHNRMNALAAVAAALALDMAEADIREGLMQMAPVKGRLCPVKTLSGARLVDDSYNANPESVAAAIAVLRLMPGRHTLVLGDLGELGPAQEEMHRELGAQAAAAGIERLLTCGQLSRHASDGFGGDARHFEDQAGLIAWLQSNLDAQDSVLIKGSRASAMDRVVNALSAEVAAC